MLDAFVVAASPAARQRLRRLVESGGVRVGAEGESLASLDGVGRSPGVVVLDDERLLADVPDVGDEEGLAVVVLARDDVRGLATRLGGLDLRGWAIVPSNASPEQVQAGIAAAASGLTAMPAGTPAEPGTRAARDADDDEMVEALTPREREVLEWLARGLSNKAIGTRLGISEHTAKFHVASVLAKLGAGNRAEAVRRGLRRGLVTL